MIKILSGTLCLLLISIALPAAALDNQPERASLSNGLTVIAQDYPSEVSSACIFVKVGPADEKKDNNGITALVNQMLLSCDPSGRADPAAIRIEQLGGEITVETSNTYSCFRLTVPDGNFGAALKALAEMFEKPELSEASLTREKEAVAAARMRLLDRAGEKGYRILIDKTFQDSPAGLDPMGNEQALSRVKLNDVQGWSGTFYRASNMVVSICRKGPAASTLKQAGEALGGLEAGKDIRRTARGSAPAGFTGSDRLDETAPATMAAALMGFSAPPAGSDDYPAICLAESILASGMGSSLFKGLRGADGSAYSFGSVMPPSSNSPVLALYAVSDGYNIERAADGLQKSVDALVGGRVVDEEVERGKGALLGRLAIRKEPALERAFIAGLYETMGLGPDYDARLQKQVERLGKSDVTRIGGKYLDRFTLVVLKPKK